MFYDDSGSNLLMEMLTELKTRTFAISAQNVRIRYVAAKPSPKNRCFAILSSQIASNLGVTG